MRALILLLMLASCQNPDPFASYKEIVAADLKAPASAQFRGLVKHGGIVCGEVNAKNSYGGYIGFLPFYVRGGKAEMASETGDDLIDVTSSSRITLECGKASLAEVEARMTKPTE